MEKGRLLLTFFGGLILLFALCKMLGHLLGVDQYLNNSTEKKLKRIV
jgi:hypothetical protein